MNKFEFGSLKRVRNHVNKKHLLINKDIKYPKNQLIKDYIKLVGQED